MPEIKAGRDYPVCPEGKDIFRLKEVELKDMPNFERTGTAEKLIWKFISRQQDPETGEFYEVAVITPPYYTGNAKSKLTWLMRQIDKRVNKDWIKTNRLNTDQYVDRDYEGKVQHQLSEDGSKTYAVFAYLEPLTNTASAPAPPDADIVSMSRADLAQGLREIDQANAESDPFVMDNPGAVVTCETCGKELTDMEAIGCAKFWGDAHRFCAAHAKEQRLREAEALFAAA